MDKFIVYVVSVIIAFFVLCRDWIVKVSWEWSFCNASLSQLKIIQLFFVISSDKSNWICGKTAKNRHTSAWNHQFSARTDTLCAIVISFEIMKKIWPLSKSYDGQQRKYIQKIHFTVSNGLIHVRNCSNISFFSISLLFYFKISRLDYLCLEIRFEFFDWHVEFGNNAIWTIHIAVSTNGFIFLVIYS